jgi:hypothetical protein
VSETSGHSFTSSRNPGLSAGQYECDQWRSGPSSCSTRFVLIAVDIWARWGIDPSPSGSRSMTHLGMWLTSSTVGLDFLSSCVHIIFGIARRNYFKK